MEIRVKVEYKERLTLRRSGQNLLHPVQWTGIGVAQKREEKRKRRRKEREEKRKRRRKEREEKQEKGEREGKEKLENKILIN